MSLNLQHHFLIAMPSLEDAYFNKSLVYIIQYDEDGCLGAIINKPVETKISQIMPHGYGGYGQLDPDMPLYFGGPVSMDQGIVIHSNEIELPGSQSNGQICFSNSIETLHLISLSEQKLDFLICMGYAGWSPGQLEEELKENAWLPVKADMELLFHPDPYKKYDLALQKLGIDPAMMSQSGGNA